MEKQTTPMSAEDSIRIISEMISKTKEELRDNSFYFLLWGWIVMLACLFNFGIITYMVQFARFAQISLFSMINWGIFVFIGIFIQIRHVYRKERTNRVRSYLGDFISLLWQANGLLIVIAWLFCLKYKIYPSAFILAICGCATFVTGMLFKFKPFIIGSLFFVAFAIAALWIDNEYQLLLSSAGILAGYLIPGYRLKSSKL